MRGPAHLVGQKGPNRPKSPPKTAQKWYFLPFLEDFLRGPEPAPKFPTETENPKWLWKGFFQRKNPLRRGDIGGRRKND